MADVNTYVLALRNGTESDLDLGLGQDIGGGGHVDQEVWRKRISRQSCCTGTPSSGQSRNSKYHPIHSPSHSIPISFRIEELKEKPTLNSSLGTDGGSQTQGAGHEVGEDLVGARRVVGLVLAEIGDLQGRAWLVSGGEGDSKDDFASATPLRWQEVTAARVVGTCWRAHGAQQSAGSGGERHVEGN